MIPSRFAPTKPVPPEFSRVTDAYLQGDPVADAAEAALETLPDTQRRLWMEAAGSGSLPSEAPDALRALVDTLRVPLPQGDAGGLLFRGGLWCTQVLAAGSLMVAFASPAGNKVLIQRGMFTQDALPRLLRTARYVVAVCDPGGLAPGAPGFRETLHVRLLHSRVRRRLLATGTWKTEAWGIPVCQYDMAGTPLLFSVLLVEGLRKLGLEVGKEEADAFCLLWARAGRMMGVQPSLAKENFEEGRALLEVLRDCDGPPDEDSRRLAAALVLAGGAWTSPLLRHTLGPIRGPLTASVCRWTMGDELANSLGLSAGPADHLLPMVRELIRVQNRVDRLSRGRRVSRRLGRRLWEEMLEDQAPPRPA